MATFVWRTSLHRQNLLRQARMEHLLHSCLTKLPFLELLAVHSQAQILGAEVSNHQDGKHTISIKDMANSGPAQPYKHGSLIEEFLDPAVGNRENTELLLAQSIKSIYLFYLSEPNSFALSIANKLMTSLGLTLFEICQ
jgi:hypothetical protein